MSKEFKNDYDEVLNILYPGYLNMSDRRKNIIDGKTWQITRYASEVLELLPRMQDPQDSLYQGKDASVEDICNIAAIYARICEKSNKPILFLCDEIRRVGDSLYGPIFENTYGERKRTEIEVLHEIEKEVQEYKAKPKISIKRLLDSNCIKKYNIDYNTAIEVNEVLKRMHSKEKAQEANDKGMEIEN